MTAVEICDRVKDGIRTIPDFPQPGIVFRDITPVLGNAALLRHVVQHMATEFAHVGIDVVVAIESRGFILGAPLAVELGAGFAPVRKPGKLPHRTVRVDYDLEYGSDALEAHIDAVSSGQRVLLVDDVLATGGTASAALRLIDELGAQVVCAAFLVELAALAGRARLGSVPAYSLVTYGADE
jgi:adenine phosphoribosyltransferase